MHAPKKFLLRQFRAALPATCLQFQDCVNFAKYPSSAKTIRGSEAGKRRSNASGGRSAAAPT